MINLSVRNLIFIQIRIILILFCIGLGHLSYSQKKNQNVDPDFIDNKDIRDPNLSEMLRIQDSTMARSQRNPIDINLFVDSKGGKSFFIYDAQGEIIGGSGNHVDFGSVTLIDSLTNNYFVLDSLHIHITAYNKSNKVIWKTDPYKDSLLPEYRVKLPLIVNFKIWNNPDYFKKKAKAIWIRYNNTEFGFLNIENGKYQSRGAD